MAESDEEPKEAKEDQEETKKEHKDFYVISLPVITNSLQRARLKQVFRHLQWLVNNGIDEINRRWRAMSQDREYRPHYRLRRERKAHIERIKKNLPENKTLKQARKQDKKYQAVNTELLAVENKMQKKYRLTKRDFSDICLHCDRPKGHKHYQGYHMPNISSFVSGKARVAIGKEQLFKSFTKRCMSRNRYIIRRRGQTAVRTLISLYPDDFPRLLRDLNDCPNYVHGNLRICPHFKDENSPVNQERWFVLVGNKKNPIICPIKMNKLSDLMIDGVRLSRELSLYQGEKQAKAIAKMAASLSSCPPEKQQDMLLQMAQTIFSHPTPEQQMLLAVAAREFSLLSPAEQQDFIKKAEARTKKKTEATSEPDVPLPETKKKPKVLKIKVEDRMANCKLKQAFFENYTQYFLQITVEGKSPVKRKCLEDRKSGPVGFDLGTKDIAICTQTEIKKQYLTTKPTYERDIKRLQRLMSRADRQNPENKKCFNAQGAAIRGKSIKHSHHHRRLNRKLKAIQRINARTRLITMGTLSNQILASGDSIRFEKLNYKAMQKNYGASVLHCSPGKLIELLKKKAKEYGYEVHEFSPFKACASQICPQCGLKEKRERDADLFCPNCGVILDRDIAAAFVAMFTNKNGVTNFEDMKSYFACVKPLVEGKLKEKSFLFEKVPYNFSQDEKNMTNKNMTKDSHDLETGQAEFQVEVCG